MKNMRNVVFAAGVLLLVEAGAARAAVADVSISLDFFTLTAVPGETVTFTGTVHNLDNAIVDLNGCDVNIAGNLAADCGPFLTFSPLTIDPLDTTGNFQMFTVTVNLPYTDPYGPYTGTFVIFGGVEDHGYDNSTQNQLGQTDFTVNVVPEPGTGVLMALAGALVVARRYRRQSGCRRS